MASSASLKELSKAIHAFIPQPALPLPDGLVDTIEAYLRRHEKYDDAASDRLQEELLGTFEKHVRGVPAAAGPWIGIMRRLLPVLKTPARVLPWFNAFKGLLDRTNLDKLLVDETVSGLMDLVTSMDEYHTTSGADSATNPIIDRLFSMWTNRFYPALAEGNTSHEYCGGLILQALKSFGKKRPKEFFTSMDGSFVKRQYRKATLRFLCDFIQDQPPHLHQILHTSIFSNLLACLQHDTSTTVISLALTALIMLLPHMPSSLVPHLPTLFNIYARLLFWDRVKSAAGEAASSDVDHSRGWETCTYDAQVDDFAIARLSNYYTILYGLYPINFMDYIRKPQRYLRHANMSSPEEIEVQPTEIRHRSERFRRCHLLHSNFYTLTIDSEKTYFGRWIRSEAAEVVVDCMSLYQAPGLHESTDQDAPPPMPGPAATVVHDGSDKDRPDSANWLNSQMTSTDSEWGNRTPSMMLRRVSQSSQHWGRCIGDEAQTRGPSADSPTIPAQLTLSPSHSQLQDMIYSNKVIKSGLHQSLANDSVPSLSLSHQESVADRPAAASSAGTAPQPSVGSPSSAMDPSTRVARLQRRVLVLENDLSFERYVKQQHMGHIGELRRRLVVDAAMEAETQNLIMTNRNLKSRFEEAKKAEMQVRKESEKGRALAKKWESDLASKLKNLRDESKRATAELGALGRELDESRQECEKLRKLVCDTEVRELGWKQKVQSMAIQGGEIDRLKAQAEELTQSERDHQAGELERQAAASSAAEAEAQVEMMRMRLAAREHDSRRAGRVLEEQVKELQRQLAEAREERERPGANASLVIESALAASRARQAELQKQHNLLMRKYTALQSSLLDMQAEAGTATEAPRAQEPRAQEPQAHAPGDEYLSESASPVPIKNRRRRSGSNSEATAYNATAPLGPPPDTTASAEAEGRAGASQGGEGSGTGPLSMSPGNQRHFGSGLPSRIRKEGRDKSKEDGGSSSGKPKKEKKSSGLRGIRGFV
ncbi:Tuberous sclerosis 1 protein [Tolypocladium capitatum]|uniref:Tuberous sclerosis 1 protein n=1 Tax=Tolypocladium capitatum TaxID=45235 RepID=A0A2K3QM45_9HYPO|nr:Tuberous sclerosis 1 protein [Tolypocladium capitatum]